MSDLSEFLGVASRDANMSGSENQDNDNKNRPLTIYNVGENRLEAAQGENRRATWLVKN